MSYPFLHTTSGVAVEIVSKSILSPYLQFVPIKIRDAFQQILGDLLVFDNTIFYFSLNLFSSGYIVMKVKIKYYFSAFLRNSKIQCSILHNQSSSDRIKSKLTSITTQAFIIILQSNKCNIICRRDHSYMSLL